MPLPDDETELPATGPQAMLVDDQLGFEIDFFERILRRNPRHLDALRRQVQLLAETGRHHDALLLDQRLVDLRPEDCVAHYNMACSLSMVGRLNEALASLDNALRLGYRDIAHLMDDPDLDPLRNDPRYVELIAKIDVRC